MKILLKALGCRLNEAELEQWALVFRSNGHQIITEVEQADLVILNSCAVTVDAGRKSRQLTNRLYRQNPEAHLVVTGCYATLNLDEVAESLGVDLVVSNADKDKLPSIVMDKFAVRTMPLIAIEPGETSLFLRGRQRAFIKIQDGCRYRCTFCIVTVARGEERSRSIKEIIEEINHFHQQGLQEIVLTGVHVGGYGSDINSSLHDLVTQILAETDIPRIRFASVEPWDLPEDFFALFDNTRVMPHMHLPLQSGADTVLRRMSRRCKTGDFRQLVEHARSVVSDFNITTDIIVGFPGETEDEWQQSMEFVESIGFGHLHVFSYSPREGTKAARLPNPVQSAIKKQRGQAMRLLGERMKHAMFEAQKGKVTQVLWEKEQSDNNGNLVFFGYTPNYLKVQTHVCEDQRLENQIITTRLETFSPEDQSLLGLID